MQKLAVIIKKSGLEVSFPNPGQVPAKKKNRKKIKLRLYDITSNYPSQPAQPFWRNFRWRNFQKEAGANMPTGTDKHTSAARLFALLSVSMST